MHCRFFTTILQSLNHPYIVNVKEVINLVDSVAIVMEYAEKGELFDMVQRRHTIPESESKHLMFQILSGTQTGLLS